MQEQKKKKTKKLILGILVLTLVVAVVLAGHNFFLKNTEDSESERTGKEFIAKTSRTGKVIDETISGVDFDDAEIDSSRIEQSEISRSQINYSTIYDSIVKFSSSTNSYFINCIIMFSNITDAYLRNSIVIKSIVSNSIYRNTTFQETKTNNVINLAKTEEKYEENLIVLRIVKSRVCYTIYQKNIANRDLTLPYDGFGAITLSALENCTVQISNAEAIVITVSNLKNVSLIIKNVRMVLFYRTYFMNSTVETFNCSEVRLYDISVPAINEYRTISVYFEDTDIKLSDEGLITKPKQ